VWDRAQGVICGADTLGLISFFPSPLALMPVVGSFAWFSQNLFLPWRKEDGALSRALDDKYWQIIEKNEKRPHRGPVEPEAPDHNYPISNVTHSFMLDHTQGMEPAYTYWKRKRRLIRMTKKEVCVGLRSENNHQDGSTRRQYDV
jgi:hypothetical protein